MPSAIGNLNSILNFDANKANSSLRCIILPCFILAIQNNASSVVSSNNFLNTSYKVIVGIMSSSIFSIISDTIFQESVPAKYSKQKEESIIFIFYLHPA
jgi:hypothetical protein